MAMRSSKAAPYRRVTHAPDGRHLRCLIRDSTKRSTGQLPARSAKANESTRLPRPSRSQPCGAAESATEPGLSRAVRRLRHVRAPPSERQSPQSTLAIVAHCQVRPAVAKGTGLSVSVASRSCFGSSVAILDPAPLHRVVRVRSRLGSQFSARHTTASERTQEKGAMVTVKRTGARRSGRRERRRQRIDYLGDIDFLRSGR